MSELGNNRSFGIEDPCEEQGKPWGLFPTLFMMSLLGLAISLVSTFLLYVLFLQKQLSDPSLTYKAYMVTVHANPMDSLLVGVTSIGGTVVAVLLVLFFAWKRKGISISDYLGLKIPKITELLTWFGILLLFMFANGFLAQMIGQTEQSSKFTMTLVGKNQYFWLIVIAVAVAAPILEEFVMRGFLFEGLLHGKMMDVITAILAIAVSFALFFYARSALAAGEMKVLVFAVVGVTAVLAYYVISWFYHSFPNDRTFGAVGAILVTSIFWSLLHSQYGWYNLVVIAGLGVLFGVAKLRTGSLFVPIFLHAAHNGLAVFAVSIVMAEKAAGAG